MAMLLALAACASAPKPAAAPAAAVPVAGQATEAGALPEAVAGNAPAPADPAVAAPAVAESGVDGQHCALAVILPGVTIGDHVVIGAGSVVTKDIPSYSLAVGNPCRVIRSLEAMEK